MKEMGCNDVLLTISHYLQKPLDARMESYIVQPNFKGENWFSKKKKLFDVFMQLCIDELLYKIEL